MVGFGGPLDTPPALKLSKSNVLEPVGGAGVEGTTFKVVALLTLWLGGPLSETVAVKGNVPVAAGVPLSTPPRLRVSPSSEPLVTVQL